MDRGFFSRIELKTQQLTIPIVDLRGTFSADIADRLSVACQVRDASRTFGMFLVKNHGVSEELIAAHFEFARSFFALDLAEKRAIDVSGSNCFRGYEAFGTQTIDAAAPGDLKEGFIMGPDLPPEHPHVRARFPNTGANLWPRRPAGFRGHMETYVDAMNGLGRRLAAVIALSLGLPEDYFSAALAEPLTYSQLLYYPSLSAAACGNRLGAGEHVDWGMLTMLLQDNVGGLEVRTADATWHAAPPVPGTFVIILGEMLLRLTNGRYRSATHRVAKNTTGRRRYSMPTFFDPGYDERVACVPTCAPAQGAPRFPACTVAEHMFEMAVRTLSAPERPSAMTVPV
jgi:isopenicillin N synthase-like dioxygenase